VAVSELADSRGMTVEVDVDPRVEWSQLNVVQLVAEVAQSVELAVRVALPLITHQPVSDEHHHYVTHHHQTRAITHCCTADSIS